MPIFLDPWNPEFVPSVQADFDKAQKQPLVKLYLEGDVWEPITPLQSASSFLFVDGVRRVEARVILQNGKILFGIFGSIAAGAIKAEKNKVNFLGESLCLARIERYFIMGGGLLPFDKPIAVHPCFSFTPISVAEEGVDAPVQKLQQLMRDAEGKIIETLGERNEEILVADGPLHFPWARKTLAIGYIKSFHEWYLPPSHLPSLEKLKVGERTPLFLITGQNMQFPDRFGWFVRLSNPQKGDAPISGLARLEVAAEAGLGNAKRLANLSCGLSAFISQKFRDPRSPQNLLPIGALEKILKHRLGDTLMLQRNIQLWIQKASLPLPRE
jgi:hypothetical protein